MTRFSACDLKLGDVFPVKATFLNANGQGRHIVGFFADQNGQAQDIRILFPDVCSETLRANVSSVFLGNRLSGKTPFFFIVENGYALNAGASWFDDAIAGKNGSWRFVARPSKDGLLPALHQGEIVWKNADGSTKEPAVAGKAVLLWQTNDGNVFCVKGRLSQNVAMTTACGDVSGVNLDFDGKAVFYLHIGEKNFADLVRNRVGFGADFGGLTQIDALTVEIPADFDDTLSAEKTDGLDVEAAGCRLTLKGRADADTYESALFGVKVKTDAQKPFQCVVKLTFQTPDGIIVKTNRIEIQNESGQTASALELPASLPNVAINKPFVFTPPVLNKDDDLPSFLTRAEPVKAMEKTVLITGATGKIGKETAFALASQGWDVLLQCKTASAEITHAVDDLNRKFGVRTAYIRADFTDKAERMGLIPALSETYGAIDAVVHAADVPADTLAAAFVPVETAVALAQALAEQLPKGKTGAFVQIIRRADDFNDLLAQKALETFAEKYTVQNVRVCGVSADEKSVENILSALDNAFSVSQIKAK